VGFLVFGLESTNLGIGILLNVKYGKKPVLEKAKRTGTENLIALPASSDYTHGFPDLPAVPPSQGPERGRTS
jgi:hypothetical protein